MELFSDLDQRRKRNAKALAAFGVDANKPPAYEKYRTIHSGTGPTIFTVGYERRTGDELVSILLDAGVSVLVDVRERAMSRRADFRGKALRERCEASGIEYRPMPSLGSTQDQRDELKASGDIPAFQKVFRSYAAASLTEPLDTLIELVGKKPAAMICYERAHEECHRASLADLLVERVDATVIAL